MPILSSDSRAVSSLVEVRFAWVYPDEDGGYAPARLNLTNGYLELREDVPSDIRCEGLVRTRIEGLDDLEDEWVDAFYDRMAGCWRVRPCELDAFRAA